MTCAAVEIQGSDTGSTGEREVSQGGGWTKGGKARLSFNRSSQLYPIPSSGSYFFLLKMNRDSQHSLNLLLPQPHSEHLSTGSPAYNAYLGRSNTSFWAAMGEENTKSFQYNKKNEFNRIIRGFVGRL